MVTVKPAVTPIDQQSPEFIEAQTRETQRLIASGVAAAEAEKKAARTVGYHFKQEVEAQRRTTAAPVLAALRELEKPRGCWACTITTHQTRDGVTEITVEQYNPFEPEERLWTLMSRDGKTPTDSEQKTYRRKRLNTWKKAAARTSSPAEKFENSLRTSEFTAGDTSVSDKLLFTSITPEVTMRGATAMHMPPSFTTYSLRPDGGIWKQQKSTPGKLIIAMRVLPKVTLQDQTENFEYARLFPDYAPFLVHHVSEGDITLLGKKHHIRRETRYTDHRRVKCYDDRFSVEIGPSSILPDE